MARVASIQSQPYSCVHAMLVPSCSSFQVSTCIHAAPRSINWRHSCRYRVKSRTL
nr:hypothetical protein [Candidatus Sigynarchaeum springense]